MARFPALMGVLQVKTVNRKLFWILVGIAVTPNINEKSRLVGGISRSGSQETLLPARDQPGQRA
jgi:hypothetical protein